MQQIEIIKRDDVTFTVLFADEDGVAIDITGYTIFFTVKSSLSLTDDQAEIRKEVTSHIDPVNGETTIALTSTDTNLAVGMYFWDLQMKDINNKISSSSTGNLYILQDVTIRTA